MDHGGLWKLIVHLSIVKVLLLLGVVSRVMVVVIYWLLEMDMDDVCEINLSISMVLVLCFYCFSV